MTDPDLEQIEHLEQIENQAVGLELQIVELVEQRERATVQGREDDAARLQLEIESLQLELAGRAEETAVPETAVIDAAVAEDAVAEAASQGEDHGPR